MNEAGTILNSTLAALSLWGGYSAMSPDHLNTNADWIFFLCCLLLSPIAPLMAVAYSVSAGKCQSLRRPSWRRFSLSWRHDPLQCLQLTIVLTAAFTLGAVFHIPFPTSAASWAFASLVALLGGFIVGRFLTYAIFRDRIQSA